MHKLTFICERRAWRLHPCGRLLLGALLAGLSVLMPLSGHAEEQGRVKPFLLSAGRYYEALEYERALEELAKARRFALNADDAVLLSLYEGVIQADLGRTEESDSAFRAALALHPEAELPLSVSPKVAERLEAIRRQAKLELEAKAKTRAAFVPPRTSADSPVAPWQLSASGDPHSHVETGPDVSAQASLAAPPASAVPDVARVPGGRGARTHAWLPATVGGGLLVGSGVSYLLARGEQSKLRGDDTGLESLEDAKRSASRGRTYQSVGLTLAGAGVVSLGISAGLYLLGRSSESQTLAIDASTDGTSAFVQGRWP